MICSNCNEDKDDFSPDASAKRGFKSRCRPCQREIERARYQLKKKEMCARKKAWRMANPERVQEIKRKCRRGNLAVDAANSADRRAKRHTATPAWANKEMIKEYYAYAKLLSDVFGEEFHVDHIAPLRGKTVSGLHVEHNLQILPASENCKKGNTWA